MEAELVTTPHSRSKWVVGISLIVAAIVGLGVWAFLSPGALAYYKTPSEITALHIKNTDHKTYRIGGRLAPGTLRRDGRLVTFSITDGKKVMPVVFSGEVPDTLKEGTDVVVEGNSWTNDGDFAADRVQAKCSSKFVPKDKPEHLGRT